MNTTDFHLMWYDNDLPNWNGYICYQCIIYDGDNILEILCTNIEIIVAKFINCDVNS